MKYTDTLQIRNKNKKELHSTTQWTALGDNLLRSTDDRILPPSKLFIGSRLTVASPKEAAQNTLKNSDLNCDKSKREISAHTILHIGPAKASKASFLYEHERLDVFIKAPKMLSSNDSILIFSIFAKIKCPSS